MHLVGMMISYVKLDKYKLANISNIIKNFIHFSDKYRSIKLLASIYIEIN